MKIPEQDRLRWIVAYVAIATLVLASAGLAVALLFEAGKDRQILVVPGPAKERLVMAGEVSDDLALDFAELYLTRYENYTPESVSRIADRLSGLIVPGQYHAFMERVRERVELTRESGVVSQFVILHDASLHIERGKGALVVEVRAVRRLYIADRPTKIDILRYRVTIEPGTPTAENPYGLFIAGHRTAPLKEEDETR